jgi:GT2 family glycosyltransferase
VIPVLGIPVLNHNDLLDTMLRSIDHPVKKLYVVDNGGTVPHDMAYDHLPHIFRADVGYNVGVAASWNLIIRANMHEGWWLICNNDLTFEPGVLDRLVQDVESHLDEPNLSMVMMGNEPWGNHFGAFAVNDHAIDTVGWFDENFHPIYFEDTDWKRRAKACGIRMSVVKSTTYHIGNASWKGDHERSVDNERSWRYNTQYYDEKWRNIESLEPGWDETEWTPPPLSRLRATSWRV